MPENLAPILVVDDDPRICEMIDTYLTPRGLPCTCVGSGPEALTLLEQGEYPLLISDVSMPALSGLELLQHVRAHRPQCRVILTSGLQCAQSLAEALLLGAYDFILKPFDLDQVERSVRQALSDRGPGQYLSLRAARAMLCEPHLRQVSLESIRALVHAVEAKDPYTRKHSEHVARYSIELARHLQVSDDIFESIRTAALLHDCGKIGIPDNILTKPGALTDEEFAHIRRHPAIGFDILAKISLFQTEATLVRAHHERWDGKGYPDGLRGDDIPFGARVIHLADCIDAMLMRRTYKEPYPLERVLQELDAGAGSQFDPRLARAAIDWCSEYSHALIRWQAAA